MTEPATSTRWSTLIFLFVWLLSAVYMGLNLNHGWVPHDEGTLGQSAERVLRGEMPHRDFFDPYTGGLAYVDAAIFELFGINLFWLRLFLFVCFVAWVPAIYALAREFLSPWPAAGVTLIAVAWSVPNYPAAMPSWFNLFFATFGTLALTKYIRRPAVHWLILAGLCGGLSFLIKSAALYYIAAALLFFVFREQALSRNQASAPCRTFMYLAFLSFGLSIFVFALIKLIFAVGGTAEYLHFVFPGFLIAALLICRERFSPSVPDIRRFATLLTMAVPFLLATLLPIIGLLFVYWLHDALPALTNGLLIAPFRRLNYAVSEPPGILLEFPCIFATLLILAVAGLRERARIALAVFIVCVAALILYTSPTFDLSKLAGLYSAWGVVPVLALIAIPVFSSSKNLKDPDSETNQRTALLVVVTVVFSLIQFPFSELVYFCYIAPIAALAAAALVSRLTRPPRLVLAAAIVFYFLFGVLDLRSTLIHSMNHRYDSVGKLTSLRLPRAGNIVVPYSAALEYEALISLIRDRVGEGSLLAGPDCPEVYFLSGSRNPTPVIFDFFEDPLDYKELMQGLMDRPNLVKVLVVNEKPEFSELQLRVLRALAISRYSESRKIGHFTVYWRR